ncbi:hypothetical protein ACFQ0B_38185 [Nonomuraea thailandensis]
MDKRGGLNELRWRGAAGASGYIVERSARGRWVRAHEGLLTDDRTPWLDAGARGDVTYRVVPVDRLGRRGAASEPVRAGAAQTVLTDPLETTGLASGHANVTIVPGDGTAVARADGQAWMSWSRPGLQRVLAGVTGRPRVRVQVSDDGRAWRTVRHETGDGQVTADAGGAGHVRVLWNGDCGATACAAERQACERDAERQACAPDAGAAAAGPVGGRVAGLTRVTLWSADPAPVTAPPASFAPLAPASGAQDVLGTPAFTWGPAAGAAFYTLAVSERADLSDPVLQATGITGTAHTPSGELEPGTTYHWRITAVNAAGRTGSAVASFSTRPLPTAPAVVDDFETFADSAQLAAAYVRNPGGDLIVPELVPGQAMRLDYTLGGAGYAGVTRTFSPPSTSGAAGPGAAARPDGRAREGDRPVRHGRRLLRAHPRRGAGRDGAHPVRRLRPSELGRRGPARPDALRATVVLRRRRPRHRHADRRRGHRLSPGRMIMRTPAPAMAGGASCSCWPPCSASRRPPTPFLPPPVPT